MSLFIAAAFLFTLFMVNALHLSTRQLYSARGLLLNHKLTPAQRQSVQTLLYSAYEKWAIKKATDFKKQHPHKCRDLSTQDLILAGKMGLLKSSQRYDGRAAFDRFSEIYVKSELLRTLSAHLAITNCISLRDRMRSGQTRNRMITINADCLISSNQQWISNRPFGIEDELYRNAWLFVDKLDAFSKRVMLLKYDYGFKTQKSNKRLAELMCCSEETVRKVITRTLDGLRREIIDDYASM